jgi:hypothetical protein
MGGEYPLAHIPHLGLLGGQGGYDGLMAGGQTQGVVQIRQMESLGGVTITFENILERMAAKRFNMDIKPNSLLPPTGNGKWILPYPDCTGMQNSYDYL